MIAACPTPQEMLEFYVRQSPESIVDHVEAVVDQLDAKDMARLLAYQVAHLTILLQQATGAPTANFADAKQGGSA